jgi:branched-subunit amino acid aminotransferase/4-amino-4-deoxychorismate lyase
MNQSAWVWLSGEDAPLPAGEATVPVLDGAYLHGEALYETLRTYHGCPFALAAHLSRLLRGATSWGFPPVDAEALARVVGELAALRAPAESAFRITLSRGPQAPWAPDVTGAPLAWSVYAGPLPPHVHAVYERGVRCILASRVRWNPGGFIPAVKFAGNPEIAMAKREAAAVGAFESILLNPSGLVAEGSSSNLFLVKERRLVTPSLGSGILDGVTRAAVLRLAAEAGLPVEERDVAPWELLQAEEIFLTSTLKEVVPVVRLGDRAVGTGDPGRITDRLLGAYQEHCLKSCALR